DAAHTIHRDDLLAHQAAEPPVQVFVLGKPAVPTEVELVAPVLYGPAQTANVIITLQHGHLGAVRGQLVGSGEATRTGAQHDNAAGIFHGSARALRHRAT